MLHFKSLRPRNIWASELAWWLYGGWWRPLWSSAARSPGVTAKRWRDVSEVYSWRRRVNFQTSARRLGSEFRLFSTGRRIDYGHNWDDCLPRRTPNEAATGYAVPNGYSAQRCTIRSVTFGRRSRQLRSSARALETAIDMDATSAGLHYALASCSLSRREAEYNQRARRTSRGGSTGSWCAHPTERSAGRPRRAVPQSDRLLASRKVRRTA